MENEIDRDLADVEVPVDSVDEGKTTKNKMSMRRCAIKRELLDRQRLIRFVAGPEGELLADVGSNLPGRGIWISADRRVLAEGVKKNVFARGLRRQVSISETFLDDVESALRDRAIAALSLAKKAGRIVTGSNKVERAVEDQTVQVLIMAKDSAEDGRRKVKQSVHRTYGDAEHVQILDALDNDTLSQALGQPNVMHAALLTQTGIAERAESTSMESRDKLWMTVQKWLEFSKTDR